MRNSLCILLLWSTVMSSAQATDMAQDLSIMQREVPLFYTSAVSQRVKEYAEIQKEESQKMLSKFEADDLPLRAIFIENAIPDEFRYMVLHYYLQGKSEIKDKKGPFFLSTNEAKRNGLEVSKYIDERYDLYKSVKAFCNEISRSHKITQNWGGALVNYISGEKTILESTDPSNYPKKIEELPYSTGSFYSGYVSSVYLAKKSKELGFVTQADTMKYKQVQITKYTTLYQLSAQLAVSYERLKELNPQYKLSIVPNDGRDHYIKLPAPAARRFDELGEDVYTYVKTPTFTSTELKIMEVEVRDTITISKPSIVYEEELVENFNEDIGKEDVYYTVRSGDILMRIADLFDCEVAEIVRWNNISKDRIDADQQLVIKVHPERKSFYQSIDKMTNAQRAAILKAETKASLPESKTENFNEDIGKVEINYTVRSGDILIIIADLFDCEVAEIVRWNNISKDRIDADQQLVIKVDPERKSFYQSIDKMNATERTAIIKRD